MVVTYRSINKIRFPVYELPSGNWQRTDGLLFLDDKILDDSNMSGDTLGMRRLQTPHKNLFPLKNQVDNLRGVLKSNTKHFIDSNGHAFIYEKSEFCKLKYYRIDKVKQKDTASLLKLTGVKNPFVIPRPPAEEMRYAGVLHFGELPWVLYEYSEDRREDTRRKV
ncbi:MAG: hypothetical protein DWQ49_02620 [Bacteroidetes bacterium]|nr:MAG: hypothetical protein DWQ49_02620 [Bacteroidota bacterium]